MVPSDFVYSLSGGVECLPGVEGVGGLNVVDW